MALFEKWFPACKKYGMTESEFWKSNPRKIKVYEQVWKAQLKEKNELIHMWVGNYGMSALTTAFSMVLQPMFCKSQSQAKYMDEPVQIFPLTEEEKIAKEEELTRRFQLWGDMLCRRYKNPDT